MSRNYKSILSAALVTVLIFVLAGGAMAISKSVSLTTSDWEAFSDRVSSGSAHSYGYNHSTSARDVDVTLQYSDGSSWKAVHVERMEPGISETTPTYNLANALWRTRLNVVGIFWPTGCTASGSVYDY